MVQILPTLECARRTNGYLGGFDSTTRNMVIKYRLEIMAIIPESLFTTSVALVYYLDFPHTTIPNVRPGQSQAYFKDLIK